MIEFIEKLNEKFSKRKKYFTIWNGVVLPKRSLILDIHDFLIFEFARTELEIQMGTRDVATLDYVLFVIKSKVLTKRSKNNNILVCAAYLMHYLLCGHCFTDGNK